MRWILALSLLLGGIVAAGCSSMGEGRGDLATSRSGAAIDEKYQQFDPVCGVHLNPRCSVTDYYEGNTYYFHSEECRKNFHNSPTAYFPLPPDEALQKVQDAVK